MSIEEEVRLLELKIDYLKNTRDNAFAFSKNTNSNNSNKYDENSEKQSPEKVLVANYR